jgi:Mn-dependent DtxR family transcriptional regulator
MINHGRQWDIDDDVLLVDLWGRNADVATISRVLGRSKYAVLARLEKLNLVNRISYSEAIPK